MGPDLNTATCRRAQQGRNTVTEGTTKRTSNQHCILARHSCLMETVGASLRETHQSFECTCRVSWQNGNMLQCFQLHGRQASSTDAELALRPRAASVQIYKALSRPCCQLSLKCLRASCCSRSHTAPILWQLDPTQGCTSQQQIFCVRCWLQAASHTAAAVTHLLLLWSQMWHRLSC